jgi:hypothetical protein
MLYSSYVFSLLIRSRSPYIRDRADIRAAHNYEMAAYLTLALPFIIFPVHIAGVFYTYAEIPPMLIYIDRISKFMHVVDWSLYFFLTAVLLVFWLASHRLSRVLRANAVLIFVMLIADNVIATFVITVPITFTIKMIGGPQFEWNKCLIEIGELSGCGLARIGSMQIS